MDLLHVCRFPETPDLDILGAEEFQWLILGENEGEGLLILRLGVDGIDRWFAWVCDVGTEVEVTRFAGWYKDLAEENSDVCVGTNADLDEILV